jgi:hypothetical protein
MPLAFGWRRHKLVRALLLLTTSRMFFNPSGGEGAMTILPFMPLKRRRRELPPAQSNPTCDDEEAVVARAGEGTWRVRSGRLRRPLSARRRGPASCVGRVSGGGQRANTSLTSGCQHQGKNSVRGSERNLIGFPLSAADAGSVPCAD